MRVLPPSGEPSALVPLSSLRPGRTIELASPTGRLAYYKIAKVTSREHSIIPVEGKVLLLNLETGRILLKPAHLMVRPLSATAKTHYLRSADPDKGYTDDE